MTQRQLIIGFILFASVFVTSVRAQQLPAVIWKDPGNISSLDLYYGPGGRAHAPHGPMTFVKEDMDGTNPKFDLRDASGTIWRAKLGLEARPETAATRLLWAVGYFADEDYFLPSLTVENMDRLQRGQELIGRGGVVSDVRLERRFQGRKKFGSWKWKHNPFSGTRELNGLRVMMALLNNWDVKDENNAVYEMQGRREFMVSDLGASFGSTGYSWSRARSKSNLKIFQHTRFISRIAPNYVDFNVPTRSAWINIFDFPDFIKRLRLRWVGKHIPRKDVRWITSLLVRLTGEQIRDAFRASGYSPEEVEGFAQVLEQRIAELKQL